MIPMLGEVIVGFLVKFAVGFLDRMLTRKDLRDSVRFEIAHKVERMGRKAATVKADLLLLERERAEKMKDKGGKLFLDKEN